MKNVKRLLLTVLLTFTSIVSVNAASGSITASTSTKTAVVGSTFTVTVKLSCSEAIGSWQFGVSYDSSYISLVSGDTNVADYGDGKTKTATYTYKFKAIKSGSAGIRISSPSMTGWVEEKIFTPSVSNASVTIKTQAQIEASYSKDNNLKSLTVEGYELSPEFDKNTTEYTVAVPDTVTSIKLSAQVNDSTARVSGTGNIDISEGINKLEVVVTAQNGSTKTYTITVDVKDLNPINVSVDNTPYTVVKKAELLTSPVGYTPTTIKIDDIEVPAFSSELTGFTVVGLKDNDGMIGMFIYDMDSKSYEKYIEIKGASLTLYPKETEEMPEGFAKTKIEINGVEYAGLKSDIDESLVLIYAMNVETGVTDYFIYDEEENSFVRYSPKVFEELSLQNEEFKLYMFALLGVSGILLLITIMLAAKNSKLKKLIRKVSTKKEDIQDEKEVAPINEPDKKSAEVSESENPREVEDNFLDDKPRKKKNKKK